MGGKIKLHFLHRSQKSAQPSDLSNYFRFIKFTHLDYPKKVNKRLFFNAKEGNIQYFKNFAANKLKLEDLIEQKDANSLTPIDWIIRKGHQPILNFIFNAATQKYFTIDNKLKLSVKDKRGWYAAHWAVICNQPEEELMSLIKGQDFTVFSPLHAAAQFGLIKKIPRLIDMGFHIDSYTLYFGSIHQTALHLAAVKGHTEVVRKLLELGANPKAFMRELPFERAMITALHCAAKGNHLEVVKLLLAAGCSPFSQDTYGDSPLRYAATNNYPEIFDLFIQKAADDKGPALDCALFYAVDAGNYQYIKPLLENGANPEWKHPVHSRQNLVGIFTYKNKRVIDNAISKRIPEQFITLLINGIDANQIDFEAPNYSTMGCIIGLIIGAFLPIPVLLWIVIPILNLYPDLSRTLVELLIAFSPFILVPTCSVAGGWLIGKKCEENSTKAAGSYIKQIKHADSHKPLLLPPTQAKDLEKDITRNEDFKSRQPDKTLKDKKKLLFLQSSTDRIADQNEIQSDNLFIKKSK